MTFGGYFKLPPITISSQSAEGCKMLLTTLLASSSQIASMSEGAQVKVKVFRNKPNVRQLRHYIRTHYHHSHGSRTRKGEHNWLLQGRAILGHGDHGTQGPGDKYQVDATVADVFLVSQYDRRRIVGRPVIYFVIDVWSRLIVGVYVGFEGP